MANDCQKCKDYRDCVGKPWYSYQEIRFCPYQVIWVIECRETLLQGNWPDSPDGSTYIDPDIKTGFRNEAYFTKAAYILGEVEARLKTTGEAGEALISQIEKNKGMGIKLDDLCEPAYRALMYAKGKRRKVSTYPMWKADTKRRGKV